jgi:hypothetical protein
VLGDLSRESVPRLRSGLRLQRCPSSHKAQAPVAHPVQPQTPTTAAACPPALQGPKWDVSKNMRFVPAKGQCNYRLTGVRAANSGFGIDGMEFTATIKPTPTCAGRVYFVQYVKVKRSLIGCVDSKALGTCSNKNWGIDTAWPYPVATNSPTDSDRPINTVDSPGMNNISNPDLSAVRICFNDEFFTYIVYEDAQKKLTPLGWMNWTVNAQAWRDKGTCPVSGPNDCSGWKTAGGGLKVGESFVLGSMASQKLDPSAPIVTPATSEITDCAESTCPAP